MQSYNYSNIDLFIARESGCVTKILTSNEYHVECDSNHSHEEMLSMAAIAKDRLQTGFSFVGLTEQWDISICLFSKMFNQACNSLQFENSRPTSGDNSTSYDTTILNGWTDPYDNELYNTATEIFEANLKKYDVSETSCEPCWREAGLLEFQ